MTSARRGGLGRGLGALIPSAPAPDDDAGPVATPAGEPELHSAASPAGSAATPAVPADGPLPMPGALLREVPVDAVRPNPKQPRQVFDEEALTELAHSVKEFGVLQPIIVRAQADGGYQLVMGERRWRAAQQAGLATVPAIVRDTEDDALLRDALLENVHRAALNPLEEAAAYQQLLQEFGSTHEELASRLGRSRPQISNTIRLLHLPVPVQRRVAAGVLSAGHARALLALDDRDAQEGLAARIVAEGLSVRATEEEVALAVAGQAPARTRRPPRAAPSTPGVAELADRLSDVLETRVRVDVGRRKGRITVEFATVDDLERIAAVMTGSAQKES